ncbi:MAG: quinol dehydrogenase rane component [Firmicutes bacterium]|nr:quinol dehydrogenase rane component [Bacillota bacterium]
MTAKVYLIKLEDGASVEEQAAAMRKAYEVSGADKAIEERDFVAIKLHVGEKSNTTYVKPALIRELVDKVKEKQGMPFLTETSTLYKGERENAVKHILHAHRHGFGIENVGAPFIMADGLNGTSEQEVVIEAELHQSVKVAREILTTDALLVVSHPTGHVAAGLGACIKNLGMGLASRMGKMRQHSAMLPEIKQKKCKFCKKCIQWCPEGAIIEKDGCAFIVAERCIGCGECLAVCRFDAVKYDWGRESGYMQRSMAEHAYGTLQGKSGKCFFFNVMVDMTKDCDCLGAEQAKMGRDIGILASSDPVAIDKATLDLTAAAYGKTIAEISYSHHDALIQIEHAAKIGMGSMDYELITI